MTRWVRLAWLLPIVPLAPFAFTACANSDTGGNDGGGTPTSDAATPHPDAGSDGASDAGASDAADAACIQCDLLTQACPSGSACVDGIDDQNNSVIQCSQVQVGTGAQGAACATASDCLAGYACAQLSGANKCLHYCRSFSDCTAPATSCHQTELGCRGIAKIGVCI